VVHTPYLLNLGASDRTLGERSQRVLAEELRRAERLGADFVVTHIGGSRPEEAHRKVLKRIAKRVDAALEAQPNSVILLLENSAGAGSLVGGRFEELAETISLCAYPQRLAVCIDTAHCHAAGYAVSSEMGWESTLAALDQAVGLDRLRLIHVNDSKSAFGSHVDRHWHIGKGTIGLSGFRALLRHPKVSHLPFIMETPQDSEADDTRNMRVMRRLRTSVTSPRV